MKNVNLKKIEKQLFIGMGPFYEVCEPNEEDSRYALYVIGTVVRALMRHNKTKAKRG